MRRLPHARRILLCAALALLGSCTTVTVNSYAPSMETRAALRASQLPPLAVGDVRSDGEGDDPEAVTVRGSQLRAPGGSYAAYLKSALVSELAGARRHDPDSTLVLAARLLVNDVSGGEARVSAAFTLTREGRPVFDRTLSHTVAYTPGFGANTAFPGAMAAVPEAFRGLLCQLFTDPDLHQAATNP